MFVSQPQSGFQRQTSRANWATFLWDLYGSCTEGLQKFFASLSTVRLAFKNTDRLSELRSQSCFSGKLSPRARPRFPFWVGIPLPSEKEWGSQLLTRTPGWLAAFMPVDAAGEHEDYWSVSATTECMSVCTEIKGDPDLNACVQQMSGGGDTEFFVRAKRCFEV